jgi:hypothetical protein
VTIRIPSNAQLPFLGLDNSELLPDSICSL